MWQFKMREDKVCNFACKIDKLDPEVASKFREKINEDYRVNMYVNKLVDFSTFGLHCF
jgi:DNA-directed RNA polymerase subunit F